MSRSKHQSHPTCRKHKCPRSVISLKKLKNGKYVPIYRKLRLRPYGMKYFIGFGGEEYSVKYGEYIQYKANKKSERFKAKREIEKNLIDN